ncbi:hypothetical protein [Deinococcus arcticus]|uniref:Uncharacterized protein n=1 Tax=Deinococcus arcticus TaxID=2136176 RepID=A0A2T3W6T7_9DEIO|nr:hypothetical protein [Deinococcus arcticus]PTA67562.1 hypothetical protein C8263_12045 [Deinococcus arcticus]
MHYVDIELVRTRLLNTEVPSGVCKEYLQLLSSLNALSLLLTPAMDADEDEAGGETLMRLFQSHMSRREALEVEYPELGVLVRPGGWQGN